MTKAESARATQPQKSTDLLNNELNLNSLVTRFLETQTDLPASTEALNSALIDTFTLCHGFYRNLEATGKMNAKGLHAAIGEIAHSFEVAEDVLKTSAAFYFDNNFHLKNLLIVKPETESRPAAVSDANMTVTKKSRQKNTNPLPMAAPTQISDTEQAQIINSVAAWGRISQQKVRTIVEMGIAGIEDYKISKEVGINKWTVYKILKAYDVTPIRKGKKSRVLTDAQKQEVLTFIQQRKTRKFIYEKFGYTNEIKQLFKEHNVARLSDSPYTPLITQLIVELAQENNSAAEISTFINTFIAPKKVSERGVKEILRRPRSKNK